MMDGAKGPLPKEPLFEFANWVLTILLESGWWIKEKKRKPLCFLVIFKQKKLS